MSETTEKTCSKCGISKPLDAYHRNPRNKAKRVAHCKDCASKRRKAYYQANKARENENNRKWREENPERHSENYRKWYAENSDSVRESTLRRYYENPQKFSDNARKWRANNAERHREIKRRWYLENAEYAKMYSQRWREENPDRAKDTLRKWREANPDRVAAHSREYRVRKQSAIVDTDISVEGLRNLHGDDCAYCGGTLVFHKSETYNPLTVTIDHVIPISRGGQHSWENTVLACWSCNSSKRDRLLSEWRPHVLVE